MCKKGYIFGRQTEEHKEKIRQTTKGLKKPGLLGNQNAANTGPNRTSFKKNDPRLTGENNPRWKPKIQKNCPVCKIQFESIPSLEKVRCCSVKCSYKYRKLHPYKSKPKTGIYQKCLCCGQEYYVKKHKIGKSKYCSPKCRVTHLKTDRSEEIKQKLSISHIGIPNPNKGKSFPQYSGENHPNWKGGTSSEEYGKEFNQQLKNKIRQRDNYKCQECGLKGSNKNHIVHHIDYNKKNNDEDNLILLCNSCHSKTNFNRLFWTERLVRC